MRNGNIIVSILVLLNFIYLAPGIAKTSFLKNKHSVEEINAEFKNPKMKVKRFIKRFEAEDREVYIARHKIVEKLNIKEGSIIADVGAGTGVFVWPFLKAVGEKGWVYAVDISPSFITHIRDKSQKQESQNLTCVLSKMDSISLPKESVDLIFVANTYHHFETPKKIMTTMYESLKPDGKLVLVDFERTKDSRKWIKKHVHQGSEEVEKELKAYNFKKDASFKLKELKENYFIVFSKNRLDKSKDASE